ncbi:hypothetical protein HIM_08389 [Hirsutella minnesotensis 3608]|uniref:Uncharacterized protein n=1 Tax=Hirsutella minnesotensis 3608 TaxID=1043627 RepID=A0A0F7ZYC8_9HYPO|nr:hypothetical protein HIM_08389 [Hirsutella minnesotensis 3608]
MQSAGARRVLVSVSPKSPHYNVAWKSPDEIVRIALALMKERNLITLNDAPAPRLLGIERWHRIHIVFDIHNDLYDPERAHLPNQNDLRVVEVYLSGANGEDKVIVRVADKRRETEVNERIRELHDWNGNGSKPPFIADHANGNVPTYPNPRTLVRA